LFARRVERVKVGRQMQQQIFTIQQSETVEEAQALMAVNGIRHLPVLDGAALVGIISERDIRAVLIPQRSTSAGKKARAYYLPRDILVEEAMTADPLWVTPESDIEEAARLLVSNKIGCLPVMDNGGVVGIITDTDILTVFSQIMGILEASSRVDVELGRDVRALEKATEIIRRNGGNIISVGILPGTSKGGERKSVHSFRLQSCNTEPIVRGLTEAGFSVKDEIG
jgi:acetoin utilization protein AcuB